MDQETLSAIAEMLDQQNRYLDEKLEQHTRRVEIKMENELTKRIDSLFDGYKLTHEKQWELERKMEALSRRIEELENRIA